MSRPMIYKPHWETDSVDMSACRASVGRGRMGVGQCVRKGREPWTDDDGTEYLFCKQHHPDAQAKRDAEANAKYAAEREREHRGFERRRLVYAIARGLVALPPDEVPESVRALLDEFREVM